LFVATAVVLAITEALGSGLAVQSHPRTEPDMNVFVAGASGTIGIPLVRALVAAGHHVTALTSSPGKRKRSRRWGIARRG
jgi:NADPH:quinone reductase-like Zn-dependent oxidoreductase